MKVKFRFNPPNFALLEIKGNEETVTVPLSQLDDDEFEEYIGGFVAAIRAKHREPQPEQDGEGEGDG